MKINHIYQGDALEVLKTFPDECVDTIITSPPYWSLRDYKVEKQLGLENTLEEYLEKLLLITSELKRVLKPKGVMFWVHGNSYSGYMGKRSRWSEHPNITNRAAEARGITFDFKPDYTIGSKCLTNQNYRLAILMQDKQGWIQRNEIVWAKPNYMPSGSVRDRFTNSHESIFMFSKEQKYYFDIESIRIPYADSGLKRKQYQHTLIGSDPNCKEAKGTKGLKQGAKPKTVKPNKKGKKPHDVWTISPASGTKEKHFACVDKDTEILTINGWKKHNEIKKNEKVASYNLKKKIIEWQPVSYIKEYDFDGELISVGNRDLDILMTFNHRNIVSKTVSKKENNKKTYFRKETIVRADKLAHMDKIRVRAPFNNQHSTELYYQHSIGKTWAELIGWVIADGHYKSKNIIEIYQNKGINEKNIDRLLSKAEIKNTKREKTITYKTEKKHQIIWYLHRSPFTEWMYQHVPKKELNKLLSFLPINELKTLFNGLISGDGHRRATDGRISFFQKSKETMDWFQIIALKLGYHCIISKRKDNRIYQAFLTNREYIGIRKTNGLGKNIRHIKYKGKVWCPSTKNTTWVARRNGRIFITGNTFPPKLLEPMIKGTCPLWVCKKCGKPRERIVKRVEESQTQEELDEKRGEYAKHQLTLKKPPNKDWQSEWITLGWTDCECGKGWKPGVVLDPFFGRGTTALVALKERRNWIGIELNPEYISIAEDYLNLKRNLNRFITKKESIKEGSS